MADYQNWADDPDRLRTSATSIQELEARIRQVPPSQRTNYQLRMMGIEIPPGYRLDPKSGSLDYVAVDNSKHWYNEAKYMIPAIASGGLAAGALAGMGGAAAIAPEVGIGGLNTATLTSIPGVTTGVGAGIGAGVPTAASLIAGSQIAPEVGIAGLDPSTLTSIPGVTTGIGAGLGKAAGNALGTAGKALANSAADGIPEWARAAIAAMSGLPALLADKGPSDEEKAYADQARRLLAQQEQRTTFQNPLYAYITKQAYDLQPGPNKAPYQYNTLDDVKIPGMG